MINTYNKKENNNYYYYYCYDVDNDPSYNSNGSSTKSSIIVTMFRCAGSIYHRQTSQERSTDFILIRRES